MVIPTRRRETRLAFALEALAAQTLAKDRFEVIVVRAGEPRGPLAQPPDGLRTRRLAFAGAGRPAAQRNLGWRAAAAPLVAFTDDDCRPAPYWLERLLAASRGVDAFVQGRTEPDPDESALLHGWARSMEVLEPDDWYPTCNMAYPRELLERLGGFDEAYPHAWGEDTDLGLRAGDAGAERVYADDALVWHAVLPRTLPAVVRETVQRDTLPLIARHPIGRRALKMRLSVRRSDGLLLLAIAGVVALRRGHPVGAALTMPYLTERVAWDRFGLRTAPLVALRIAYHLPARLLVDLLRMAVTVRSAIRLRFPAL